MPTDPALAPAFSVWLACAGIADLRDRSGAAGSRACWN
jgi:hypothetical protein